MKLDNYIRSIESVYGVEINKNLRKIIEEHFGDNLNIYTEQDMYEQSQKIIQTYKYKYKK